MPKRTDRVTEAFAAVLGRISIYEKIIKDNRNPQHSNFRTPSLIEIIEAGKKLSQAVADYEIVISRPNTDDY